VRAVSEKEALKLFKEAKAERKEDFGRAIPRSEAEVVAQTEYAPLLAYYKIANGGYLSDEYRFLDHATAVHESAELQSALLSEELIERRPDGVVFATAADGDRILLCKDGNVLRFGHEEPVPINEWMSLSQFVVDAIND